MKIVTIIPLARGVFKEDLTYFTAKNITLGDIASVTIRNRKILGLVVAVEEVSSTKSDIKDLDFSLKKITEVKEKSIFQKEYLDATLSLSRYFVAKKNTAIASLLPAIFLEKYDKIVNLIKDPTLTLPLARRGLKEVKNIKTEKLLLQANTEDRFSYYKTLIRGSFAQKKSVFMVLPTLHDIDNFYEKLSKGIENFTFIIHGTLTPKQQLERFEKIITSEHPVLVLGTAPYLSIPRTDFETIILEHESSNAYKMIAPPYFDLRTFVELYATKIGARFILGDSLLRYETIARREIDNLSEVSPLSFRVNFRGNLAIVSFKKDDETFKILSNESIEAIKRKIEKRPARNASGIADAGGENVFIFSLRKGLATMTVCRDCSEPVMCSKCLAPVVLYLSKNDKKRMFICNRCSTQMRPETVCGACGSWNLIPLGIGTDTVYEELKKVFKNAEIFQLDKEIAKTSRGAEEIIKDWSESKGGILVGTEMALLYMKGKVPLSIIASFDSLWSIPNFRMGEKIIQLLISIIAKTEDKLIIQTKNTKDNAIVALENENLLSFVREELKDRENLGYPPYQRFIKITHLGNKEDTIRTKTALSEVFKDYHPLIFSGFIAKQKDKYMTNALIKLDIKKWSLPELSTGAQIDNILFEKLVMLPKDFSINIDPEDLL